MPRIDDYYNAAKIAIEALDKEPPKDILKRSGFDADASGMLVPFLNRTYRIGIPGFDFSDTDPAPKDVPIQEQVLILHYLQAGGLPVSHRQLDRLSRNPGRLFLFQRLCQARHRSPEKNLWIATFRDLSRLPKNSAARPSPQETPDSNSGSFPGFRFSSSSGKAMRNFRAEANILFDETIGDILSPEDVAWLAGMLVYRLMALSR